MSRFVALLRAVNVGNGNKLLMADFRAALEDLGHTAVRTPLNSGNAVFSAASGSPAKLAAYFAYSIQARFGAGTLVIAESAAKFKAIVANNPVAPPETESSRFLVTFAMDRTRLEDLAAVQSFLQPGDRLAVTEHAAYLHCAGAILQSKAGKALLRKGRRSSTTRNCGATPKLASPLRGIAAT